ncbi:MAG: PIN domain-containing protein [Veillonellales bacterium]
MTTIELFVIDTNTIIRYFHDVFHEDVELSNRTRRLVQAALNPFEENIKLSIPSIVFVEIYEKWLKNEEFSKKFHYEVFLPIKESPNIEIKPIDKEVLFELLKISGSLEHHDLHDKIVLASAMSLQCKLVTSDTKLIQYVEETRIIPEVIN